MSQPLPAGMADHVRTAVLDGPHALRREWFLGRGGVVVPEEEFVAFGRGADARAIAAARLLGATEFWGILTEAGMNEGIDDHDGRILPLNRDIVKAWASNYGVFDSMLLTPDMSFAVIQTVDEFGLVGGPREAVETYLGKSVEEAHRAFGEYAHDMRSASRHLPGIARLYLPDPV